MRRLRWQAVAVLAGVFAALVLLATSFLPLFLGEIWGPLWGAEQELMAPTRTFTEPGPLVSVSPWPEYLLVPLASLLVLLMFTLVAGLLVFGLRNLERRPH